MEGKGAEVERDRRGRMSWILALFKHMGRYFIIIIFLNLGRSSRGGGQKLILEIIALMVSHPSGSHQQSSRAPG